MTRDGLKLQIEACKLRIETANYRIEHGDELINGSIEHGGGDGGYWHDQKIKEIAGLPDKLLAEKETLKKLRLRYDKIINLDDVKPPDRNIILDGEKMDTIIKELQNQLLLFVLGLKGEQYEFDDIYKECVNASKYTFGECDDVDLCLNCFRFYDYSPPMKTDPVRSFCCYDCETDWHLANPLARYDGDYTKKSDGAIVYDTRRNVTGKSNEPYEQLDFLETV